MTADIVVLAFGGRRTPRALGSLHSLEADDPAAIDASVRDARRVIVLGGDAELGVVLTRLMRAGLLDVEVARVHGLGGARRALRGSARRVPLIRDDTGTVLVGAALWLPNGQSATIHGEGVVDDTVLFDGEVTGVRIEPTATMPGLRAAVLDGRRRRWVSGRAAQLGSSGARVVRDGVEGAKVVKRSTFYRHTTGWLRVI
jgi:hypothetical protein